MSSGADREAPPAQLDLDQQLAEELRQQYRNTLQFYRANDGKTVVLNYDDRLRLIALTQQVLHGPFSPDKVPPTGALDVIGKDRRNAWMALGSMPKEQAMRKFIDEVMRLMPLLKPHLEAHKKTKEESKKANGTVLSSGINATTSSSFSQCQGRASEEAPNDNRETQTAANEQSREQAEEAHRLVELERQRQEDQRRQIQDALNVQTFSQFRAYAEQQFPNNPDQQAVLIRQLQEQHYYQYMQQIYQQQMETHCADTINRENNRTEETSPKKAAYDQSNSEKEAPSMDKSPSTEQATSSAVTPERAASNHVGMTSESEPLLNNEMTKLNLGGEGKASDSPDDDGDEELALGEANASDSQVPTGAGGAHVCMEECGYCTEELVDDVAPASMWTKKELNEFKASLRAEGGDSIIKVGHGETVTVRVPTREEGSALFWEFATDSYDIAFGLFFEWNKSDEETEVSVHISDSEDEDLDEEYGEESGDPETGNNSAGTTLVDKGPPTSVVVPIYRRDCHQEIYAGSHQYPGQGVYLLKFDNTYSLWRSKTLYYRVYYTK